MGVFIEFRTRLYFKKYQFNYFEILILLCLVMGMAMLIFSILEGLTHLKISQIGGIVGVIFCSWTIL